MNTKHDFCPGCGAQVYPEETQCPFCGRSLRSSVLMPVVVGLGGTVFALLAGALVWWVLSSPAPQGAANVAGTSQVATPEAPPATAMAPATPVPTAPVPTAPVPTAPVPAAPTAPAPAESVPAASAPEPSPVTPSAPRMVLPEPTPAPGMPAEHSSFAPPPAGTSLDMPSSVAVAPVTALGAAEEAAAGDAESRRVFAKSKQDSFAQNGLDLQVSTSGPEETVLTIKFNFSAKTAAELIIAGPFPKQCQQRGFKEILFQDPSGATWVYDIATQKMSVK